MTNHKSSETVYIEYQVQRNFVLVCAQNTMIDEDSKNRVLAELMHDCMKKIGVDAFIKLNTVEASYENMYQGVSL